MTDTSRLALLDEDEDLQKMLDRHRQEGISNCRRAWEKAARLQRFANDQDQWLDSKPVSATGSQDPNRKAKRLSMNEIGPVIQTLSGRQTMQRLEREYLPRSPAHAAFAECMTAVDKALMDACDAEQVESAAFKDGPGIQGVSCIRFEYDTLDNPGGRLLLTDWPVWQAMWPRSARKLNLADRPWHRIGFWMPFRETRSRWPGKWDKIKSKIGSGAWTTFESDGSSSHTPWAGQEGNKPLGPTSCYSAHEREFWVEYEEWRDVEDVFEVGKPAMPGLTYAQALAGPMPDGSDPLTSETLTRKELADWKLEHEAATGEKVPAELVVRKQRLRYRYAYVIGDEVVEDGDIPVERFTVLFMTGFRYARPDSTEWVSLVEKLVDAQKWNNVMLSALIRNLQINPKGLLIFEQGTFRSKKEAMEQFTSPGGVIEVPRGKLSGGAQPFQYMAGGTSPYASMVESMFSFYRESIPRLAGFNPGAMGQLGSDLRRISGEVVKSVQDAAMTSNAELFDSLRHYRREAGRTVLAFLRKFWGDRPQELAEIVGQDAIYREEPVIDPQTGQPAIDPNTGQPMTQQVNALPPPEMWQENAWKMIAVEEVAPTGDMLESLWRSLTESGALQILLQPQPDTGQPLLSSEDLTELMPRLPAPRREKMLQRIREAQQQQQMQQQQQEQGQEPEGDEGGGGQQPPVQ